MLRPRSYWALMMIVLAGLLWPGTSSAKSKCSKEEQAAAGQDIFRINRCLAKTGDEAAQYRLARAYETGEGIEADLHKAVKWYKRSGRPKSGQTPVYIAPVGGQSYGWVLNVTTGQASPGDPRAQFRLGEMYREGEGLRKSRSRARKWLKRAAAQGHEEAAQLLEKLAAKAKP